MTDDAGQPTEGAYLLPRINHRFAQAYAQNGEIAIALELYEQAEKSFDRDNVIGRAIVLRDHGWLLWQHDELSKGERLIGEAMQLLRVPSLPADRWEKEYTTTLGFEARTWVPKDPKRALKVFHLVDDYIRGDSKWVYELDNLEQIIPLTSRRERVPYILRATALRTKMVTAQEASRVSNQLVEGKFLSAPIGSMARSASRLPGAAIRQVRNFL